MARSVVCWKLWRGVGQNRTGQVELHMNAWRYLQVDAGEKGQSRQLLSLPGRGVCSKTADEAKFEVWFEVVKVW